ncbi:flagellar assembly protein FliH [uncultured Aquabacterium sp.]|uniref:FliH/SctL family protein n=1 Tax=Aquabacterium sp. TaxID=1872578 RepID=UPI0025D89BB8|nr:flagellar assembly protein FliH [uncultured Aquabacterium sp.]
MTTSKPKPQTPPPAAGGQANSSYTRFIPREELGNVSAWNLETFEPPPAPPVEAGVRRPTLAERAAAEMRAQRPFQPAAPASGQGARPVFGAAPAAPAGQQMPPGVRPVSPAGPRPTPVRRPPIVGGMPGQAEAEAAAAAAEAARAAEAAAAPAAPSGPSVDELVEQARQSGYQDGYRNGLAALESYKQAQGAQMAAYMNDQIGALANDFHHRLESLEQQLAGRIAGVALELARQVVRTELRQNPELVVTVAEEALGALLASAKQIVLRLNPDDLALSQGRLDELLQARGARVVPDPLLARGGCLVESDIAVVDATVEARWNLAAAAIGHKTAWNGGREDTRNTELPPEEREAGGEELDEGGHA